MSRVGKSETENPCGREYHWKDQDGETIIVLVCDKKKGHSGGEHRKTYGDRGTTWWRYPPRKRTS